MLKTIVTRPTDLPVTLEQLKEQVIVGVDDNDILLKSYLQAEIDYLDGPTGVLGRALMAQTVMQSFGAFSECLRLPYGPALSIASVTYQDDDDTEQTLEDWALYEDETGSYVRFPSGSVFPSVFDRPDAVTVSYSAGYSDADTVPEPLKQAIRLLAATWNMCREDSSDIKSLMQSMPFGVLAMIAPYRRVVV